MRFVVLATIIALLSALGLQLSFVEAEPIKLMELMLSQSRAQQAAWIVIALVPLVLMFVALLEHEKLRRERQTNDLLGTRLRGVRESLTNLDVGQRESEATINYLAHTDEKESITALQERLSATDHLIELHRQRNECTDLPTRIEALRQQHDTVRSKLSELVTKRGAIEVILDNLQESENDMEQTVARMEEDKNGDTLDGRMRKLMEFSRSTNDRCEQIERCVESLTQHQKNFDALEARVAPLADEETGVESILVRLSSTRNLLATKIASLEGDGETSLLARVQQFTELKNHLAERVAALVEEFRKLDTVHGEISALYSNLNQAQRPMRELDSNLRVVS